jgi:hypothetical protein
VRIGHWIVAVLAAFFFPSSGVAASEPEGRWVLRTAGRPLFLLELKADPAAPGGYSGSLTRPIHMTMSSSNLVFRDVKGPVEAEPLRRVERKGDAYELYTGNAAKPNVYTFRLTSADQAELGWRDLPLKPVLLVRAEPTEKVPLDWDPGRAYAIERQWPSNREMVEIFRADQAAREDPVKIDWSKVAAEDAARRARTKALLDKGALQSGDDFFHAAFVFQHGGEPEDYLLAHTLATVAAARGRPDATWIAAATLDRYLQSIGQKQIYGTQFRSPAGEPTTQDPYDRTLVSDALRSALGVPVLAEQEKQRTEFEAIHRERAKTIAK